MTNTGATPKQIEEAAKRYAAAHGRSEALATHQFQAEHWSGFIVPPGARIVDADDPGAIKSAVYACRAMARKHELMLIDTPIPDDENEPIVRDLIASWNDAADRLAALVEGT